MLYTLLKFLGWGALLALIGGCIGWALRALKCRGQLARASSVTIDTDEVERMRHRLANLEQVVAERDRLRIQLADVRHADSPGIVGAEIPAPPETAHEPAAAESDSDSAADAESASDVDIESTLDDESGEPDDSDNEHPSAEQPDGEQPNEEQPGEEQPDGEHGDEAALIAADTDRDEVGEAEPEPSDPAEFDLDAAAAIIGKRIELDDLTAVEGIGPKISELCSGIGVTTWRQLAEADVAELQSMLDAAGSRYAVHKPGSWPRQAELLAEGRWAEFVGLTEDLTGGK